MAETIRGSLGSVLGVEVYLPVTAVFPALDLSSGDGDLAAFAPGFAGKILGASLHITTVVAGADDDLAGIAVDIGATECTDALMAVNDANGTLNAVIACADPSIDALNTFVATDFITVRMEQATDVIDSGTGTVTLILGMKASEVPAQYPTNA